MTTTTKRWLVEYVLGDNCYNTQGSGIYRGNTAEEAIERMLTFVIEFGGLESCDMESYTATELK